MNHIMFKNLCKNEETLTCFGLIKTELMTIHIKVLFLPNILSVSFKDIFQEMISIIIEVYNKYNNVLFKAV